MAETRDFDVVIVGKGPLSISLPGDRVKFSLFRTNVKHEFGLEPREMDALELRGVGERPTRRNALTLFNASQERMIDDDGDLVGVQYVVGMIMVLPGERMSGGTVQEAARGRRGKRGPTFLAVDDRGLRTTQPRVPAYCHPTNHEPSCLQMILCQGRRAARATPAVSFCGLASGTSCSAR